MPGRFTSLTNALLVCVCAATTLGAVGWQSSALADDAEHVIDLRTQSPAEVKIQAELDTTTQVDFIDTPLTDTVQFLADQHGIPIIIDEMALLDDGLGTDEPISIQLSKVSLKSALKIMLEPLGLTTIVEDEVMKITTEAKAEGKVTTHVYDVRALTKHKIDSNALVELIPIVIAPDSWNESKGSIKSLPGVVIVRNTAKVQGEVKDLFAQLERLGLSKAAAPAVSQNSTDSTTPKVATR